MDALAVILPVACCGCGAPDRAVCASCRESVVPWARTEVRGERGFPVSFALDYTGVVRRAFLAFKESGRTDVAAFLAPSLRASVARAVRSARGGALGTVRGVELTTVPSTRAAFRHRGYHPVGLLLRRARLPVVPTLRAVRQTRDQSALGRGARSVNRGGSLVARRGVAGRRFLVVDDIVTSGATLLEACRALEVAGAEVAGAAVVARTTMRRESGVRGDVRHRQNIRR